MNLTDIQSIIEQAVPNSTVYILDPMNDGQHLQAFVISPVFEGMMLIKQHQMIMKPLKEALASSVHALALKTFTPQKWEEVKDQFGIQ
jgi:acid stress-induced BolA-like protein IbaG/YrbA